MDPDRVRYTADGTRDAVLVDSIPLADLWFDHFHWRGVSGVYFFHHVPTDRVYVGSGIDINRRVREHVKGIRSGRHPNPIVRSVCRKYGPSGFHFGAAEVVPEDSLATRELSWIRALWAEAPAGFNLASPDRLDPFAAGKWYVIRAPDGCYSRVRSLSRYCRDRGLNQGQLASVARGESRHHRGYVARLAAISWNAWLRRVPKLRHPHSEAGHVCLDAHAVIRADIRAGRAV
ncbi:MAG: hypothetical protein BWY85_00200 [Firmicutes bacterium ADurb.Bin506]|nr:MAG: hypothetical protein BWY85_00200 [Firmicutes bacterium ADurb.Bin506]